MIGVIGAHRVGKSTLCREVASVSEIKFFEKQTSSILTKFSLDLSEKLSFDKRMDVQEAMLKYYNEVYENEIDRQWTHHIVDRTPIDLMAYTIGDVAGDTALDYSRLHKYMQNCIDTVNRYFSVLILVRPGIPLVYEKGKAPLNKGYIEHLDWLMHGIIQDELINPYSITINRDCLGLEDRVNAVLSAYMDFLEITYSEVDENTRVQ